MSAEKRSTVITGWRRWIYGPFALALMIIIALGLNEGLPAVWPYVVLLPIFIVQLAWPTKNGWLLACIAWGVFGFGIFTYHRFVNQMIEFGLWFLILWGVVPLVLLIVARPKRASA
jgi:hypothetical protein